MNFKTSKEMYEAMADVRECAIERIKEYMDYHKVDGFNMLVDKQHHTEDDDDYDEYEVWDNRVWVTCNGKYSAENAYLTSVKRHAAVDDDSYYPFALTAEDEDEDVTYTEDFIEVDAYTYIGIVGWLEEFYPMK